MNRTVLLLLVVIGSPSLLLAGDLMPPHVASRMGLEQAWRRQMHVPAGAQSIVDQQLYVHFEDQREYVEILVQPAGEEAKSAPPQVMFRLPTDRLQTNGLPVGKAEAERLARNENRRLKRRGMTGQITSRKVPKIRLYTISDDGTVDCRDAESGESVWMVRVGNRRLPYDKLGISEDFVTVINGANLLKLDVKNGEEIQTTRTSGTPLFGAVHAGDFSLVPTIRNGVEGYPLSDPTRFPFRERVEGIALAPPSKAPGTTRVAWGTDAGYVFVMELQGTPSVLFRLDTDGIVSGRIATAPGDRFFFGSEAGQVYGLRATRSGQVLWSRPYGEPFYHDPMVVGEKLLIRSTYGQLYCLGLADGISTWAYPIPGVDELLAAFDGKAYVRLLTGGIAVVDIEAGKIVDRVLDLLPNQLLVNNMTNRLYLVSDSGAVQCLRPEGKLLPEISPSVAPAADKEKETEAEAEPAGPQPVMEGAGDDPFAGGAGGDPFGADAGPDPFGGDGGAADMDDPFGGADPFGGN